MKDGLFHFKRFSVSHSGSSMKVGVDGVLIGAWANCGGGGILDVGTGCGVIALMLAQRNPLAQVEAIDVDPESVEEAASNFCNSQWSGRLSARLVSFEDAVREGERKYDLIVSNPPYFNSGVTDFCTSRIRARHQGELSPAALIMKSPRLLKEAGRVSVIVPTELQGELTAAGVAGGLVLSRLCLVQTSVRKNPKRVMLEFVKGGPVAEQESEILTMFDEYNNPTERYLSLCHEFYLKF